MKKKLLCMGLVAVFALSALMFAGCGGEGENAELEKQLSAAQATVQTQKEELDALKKEKERLQKQIDELKVDRSSLGVFYSLEDGYNRGYLTKDDILHIAYYSMVSMFGYDTISSDYISEEVINFKPTAPEPKLTEQEESAIITAYYRQDPKLYAEKEKYEVKILEYYGRYNGAYSVCMWTDFYGYGATPFVRHEINGIYFLTRTPGAQVFIQTI